MEAEITPPESAAYYSRVAADYDFTYATASHRRVYDQLTRAYLDALVLPDGATVVDVGCGTGRWLPYWLERGCRVIGVEAADGMLRVLDATVPPHDRLQIVRAPMETVDLPPGGVDLVVALGSVQYAHDPGAMLRRFHRWLRPGGTLGLYVDSLVALVLERERQGYPDQADELLRTRRGRLRDGDASASMRLFDREALGAELRRAGFAAPRCHGLAVGATLRGRDDLARRMASDEAATLEAERRLGDDPALVDLGLHILALAARPPG